MGGPRSERFDFNLKCITEKALHQILTKNIYAIFHKIAVANHYFMKNTNILNV